MAWLAHVYTATGAMAAFFATAAIFNADYRLAFLWLFVQVVIDATDGFLARALRVKERLPWFDGAKLDDIIDYLCYVFIPALIVWRSQLVPAAWSMPVVAAMLLSSAYGFNRTDAKTEDHYFLGFPSYWNIVALYLFVVRWPPHVNAIILLVLAIVRLCASALRLSFEERGASRVDARPWCGVGSPSTRAGVAASRRFADRVTRVACLPRLLSRPLALARGSPPVGVTASRQTADTRRA